MCLPWRRRNLHERGPPEALTDVPRRLVAQRAFKSATASTLYGFFMRDAEDMHFLYSALRILSTIVGQSNNPWIAAHLVAFATAHRLDGVSGFAFAALLGLRGQLRANAMCTEGNPANPPGCCGRTCPNRGRLKAISEPTAIGVFLVSPSEA